MSKEKEEIQNQKSQQELLLDKIRHILKKTNPELWKKGGYPLNMEERFEKPRQFWEELYSLDIPTGVLAIRSSTPVKSEFAGRGFQLKASDKPIYSTEIRASGWHHSELTDPYKRSQISDRTCTVLAEGEIAKDIYFYVEDSYDKHFHVKQQEFDKKAYEFVCSLPQRLKKETLSNWERVEDKVGEIHYVSSIDKLTVDVAKVYQEERELYTLHVKDKQLVTEIKNQGIAKDLFHAVEDLGQTSRLMTLTRALEQI